MFGSNNRDSISLNVVALSEHLLNTFPVYFLTKKLKLSSYKIKIIMPTTLIFADLDVEY